MLRDTRSDLGASNELWRVRLASGEQSGTLDQLDAAFEAGHINAATMVCPPGAVVFVRLGAIAGLDAEAGGAQAGASVDVNFDHVARVPASPELPEDARAFRPRWSYQRLLAVPALLAAIAIIAFAAQASASGDAVSSAAAAAGRSEMAAPAAPVAAAAEPKPVAAALSAPPASAPRASGSASALLTAPQKKALAAKDKKVEASRSAKRAAAPQAAPQRSAAKKSSTQPFTKGGNKHDPLNASL